MEALPGLDLRKSVLVLCWNVAVGVCSSHIFLDWNVPDDLYAEGYWAFACKAQCLV